MSVKSLEGTTLLHLFNDLHDFSLNFLFEYVLQLRTIQIHDNSIYTEVKMTKRHLPTLARTKHTDNNEGRRQGSVICRPSPGNLYCDGSVQGKREIIRKIK